ncbi:MAG: hypothetical protein JSV80_05580 [Acidobacteriota bacterium]|nr:MAG: hypothetical protein JSV80_05580 [Acidobacteriota bacterium]
MRWPSLWLLFLVLTVSLCSAAEDNLSSAQPPLAPSLEREPVTEPGCQEIVLLFNRDSEREMVFAVRITQHLFSGETMQVVPFRVPPGQRVRLGCSWPADATRPVDYEIVGATEVEPGYGPGPGSEPTLLAPRLELVSRGLYEILDEEGRPDVAGFINLRWVPLAANACIRLYAIDGDVVPAELTLVHTTCGTKQVKPYFIDTELSANATRVYRITSVTAEGRESELSEALTVDLGSKACSVGWGCLSEEESGFVSADCRVRVTRRCRGCNTMLSSPPFACTD